MEAAGYRESDRDAAISVRGQDVSVHDFRTSAWTIRKTFDTRSSESATKRQTTVPMYRKPPASLSPWRAAAEIIGSGQPKAPAADDIRKMITWFGSHAVPGVEQAIGNRRSTSS
ncbi:hypothetical protein RGR602_CH00882 [Rhizobium gallicum bv. gallicum R602sp]|uniref:Uncharacterized protein n=1 Tax=Rhizobium gallicum bv. gallicum R602sp TaxID=1041138 RepID=A0A0B4X105_9HYPH|nr:hypothetical protein RGR602_CH00882 [Rhizobium gallicum bv. gallicum R602sp]